MCEKNLDVAGQPARGVDKALRLALQALSHAHCAAVICFAEILTRRLYRELGYSSIHHYAANALGFSPSRTAQFLRLAEALNRLPLLRAAVLTGQLGWTKAIIVAAIATERTEAVWLAEAQRLSRPDLAHRATLARARAREAAAAQALEFSTRETPLPPCPPAPPTPPPTDPPPPPAALAAHASPCATGAASRPAAVPTGAMMTATSAPADGDPPSRWALFAAGGANPAGALPPAGPLHVTLRFSPAQYARWAAQIERARKLAVRGSRVVPGAASREELLLAALDELIAAAGRDLAPIRPAGTVCPPGAMRSAVASADDDSRHAATATDAPARQQHGPPYQIILFRCEGCGGTRIQTPLGARTLSRPTAEAAACDARVLTPEGRNVTTIAPAVRRAVLVRDGYRCRAPGCTGTRFLEVHHRVPRARGGTNRPDNLITLCAACHRLRHELHATETPDTPEARGAREAPKDRAAPRGSGAA
jgi:hypothetical protein